VTTYGITSTGPVIKRLADIKSEYEASYKEKYGNSFDVSASSPEGQMIGIESEREALLWELFEDLYYAGYPDTAFGVSLDNCAAINAVLRLAAAKSTVVGQGLFGDIGTVIPQDTVFSVEGDSASRYLTTASVTLTTGVDAQQTLDFSAVPDAGAFVIQSGISDSLTTSLAYDSTASEIEAAINALDDYSDVVVSGAFPAFTIDFSGDDGDQPQPVLVIDTNTLTATSVAVTGTFSTSTTGSFRGSIDMIAEATGTSYVANARTLNVIETPITGLTKTYNPSDSVAGREVETDSAYRLRRRSNLVTAEAGPLEAIRNSLLKLNNIVSLPALESVVIYENITLVTDIMGIPGKSFEVFIHQAGGATSRDQEIADTIWASKPAGIEAHGDINITAYDSQGFAHTVGFSRLSEINIYLDLTLTTDSDYPADGDAQVLAAILAWGNGLGGGETIVVKGYNALASQFNAIPGILNLDIKIGVAPNPTTDSNITINATQLSRWDSARINIVS
jgi:uncharacterized phage protein gp47/JayE